MTAESTPWIDGRTIGQTLRETARRYPDREAIVFCQLDPSGTPRPAGSSPAPEACYRRTWRQFDAEVDHVARSLLALGIQKGEHVAVWATNWPQWVLLQFATARIGAVFVTVNPAYRSSELAYVLRQSDAKLLFLVDRFRKSDYFAILEKALAEGRDGQGTGSGAGSTLNHSNRAAAPVPVPAERANDVDLQTEPAADSHVAGPPGERMTTDPGDEPVPYPGFPRLRHIISMKPHAAPGMLAWNDFLALADRVPPADLAQREQQLQAGDPICIQYTSGTTGFPKGAMLTHRNILMNAFYIGDCQRITEVDRIGIPVPFYHCFGCVLGTLCCAIYGSAMIIPAEYFDPEATLDAIEHERCTSIYGVPTMFIAQLNHPTFAGRDLTSLRTGIMAGSPCPIEIMQRVVDDMHAREITIAYGLTEASPVITQTRVDDPLELRVKTVGRPLPGVEVKLVDPVTGETLAEDGLAKGTGSGAGSTPTSSTIPAAPVPVPVERANGTDSSAGSTPKNSTIPAAPVPVPVELAKGTGSGAGSTPTSSTSPASPVPVPVERTSPQGELCCRGHGVMVGYYNMPEATAAAIDADGWLHSGDLAVRQPNGYYRITGRIKDMICRGGENIYPREIEEFLYTHPAVEDVAVFGIPDPRFVEDVAAWIKLREGATLTEEELRQFCCDRLAHYKVPRHIRFVTEFPQTVTGKIQKFRMREIMQQELGLKQSETA